MRKILFPSFSIVLVLACLCLLAFAPSFAHAAQWLAIKKTDSSVLMIDKHSFVEEKPYLKAWIKVEYQSPQKNIESVDRVYNNAKALWYFDCEKRKAATIQVFQYEDRELVYSAGTTAKQADFIEPLPDSEVEIAQHYACQWQAKQKKQQEAAAQRAAMASLASNDPAALMPANAAANSAANNAPTTTNAANPTASKAAGAVAAKPDSSKPSTANTGAANAVASAPQTPTPATKAGKPEKTKGNTASKGKEAQAESTKEQAAHKSDEAPAETAKKDDKKAPPSGKAWSYDGEQGPKHWGALDPSFVACETGKQQSPIDIDKTIPAALKPLKRLQKFPLKSISHQAHALVMDAGTGNMMVLDQQPYQLKQLVLHLPAEHRLKQKAFHAELQFVHENKTGHRVIIAVMIMPGESHPAFDKILGQLPKVGEKNKALALRITPAELMPNKPAYYRYTGSMTTPPCEEGVQWVVMKEALTLSKAQLQHLEDALSGPNQRPLQDAEGRLVLE